MSDKRAFPTPHSGAAPQVSVQNRIKQMKALNSDGHYFVWIEETEVHERDLQEPLSGLIFAAKDNIQVKGHSTSWGLLPAAVVDATESAHCVEKLQQLGARLVAATNLDPCAVSATGENPFFGNVCSPRAPQLCAGGSSSGSAAAVALGLIDFALGTDSGGSVRIPAACCDVCGLQLSTDTFDAHGVLGYVPQLDSIGLFTQDLSQMDFLLEVVASDYNQEQNFTLLVPESLFALDFSSAVKKPFLQVAKKLCEGGQAEISSFEFPFHDSYAARKILTARSLLDVVESLHLDHTKLPESVLATLQFGSEISQKELDAARNQANTIREQVRALLGDANFVLTPTLPCTLAEFSSKNPLGIVSNFFLTLANVAQLPALSFPVNCGEGTLSLQLIGPAHSERTLSLIAQRLKA